MKVVFDTSVLFSAFASPQGFCAGLVEATIEQHDIFVSEYILNELERHLRGKSRLSESDVSAVLASIRLFAAQVEPAVVADDACRDANDLPILGTVVAARADVLVTGDKDLLVLDHFHGTTICSPRAFYEQFFKTS